MIDLGLIAFAAGLLALGVRRPFLWVLAYLYVDILAPQKISWNLLASVPLSLIVFVAAVGGWLVAEDKRGLHFSVRQVLMLLLLIYCGYTTVTADFPVDAAAKWSWVWKGLVFAIFLPLTLRNRLRIEAAALFMTLSAGAIIVSAGIKTVLSGGGYGTLSSFVRDNTGLYEGSTLSMVAITIIPLILWLARHGTVFQRNWMTRLFAAALIFACLLVPVGTQTRTGLLCAAFLGVLMLRHARRRILFAGLAALAAMVAIPFLPQSYLERMGTIENHQSDQSASTRTAVWAWTLDYVREHPMGGGFDAFRGNKLSFEIVTAKTSAGTTLIERTRIEDQGRAYHSAYFEVLGEQGWPGLILWLLLHGLGIVQLEVARRRLRRAETPERQSDAALANALQQGHLVYLLGALFIGVAYQPFIYLLIGLQIALVRQVNRENRPQRKAAFPLRPALKPLSSEGTS